MPIGPYDQPDYIDLAELAKRLPLSRRAIRTHVHDPICPLPAMRVGGKLVFRWTSVVAWLEQHRVESLDIDQLLADVLKEKE